MTEQPQITTAKISDLLPYANNAREHTDEQVAQVAASIKEFGWTNPLIVHNGTVVAGHARLAAARKLGMEEVPVIDRSDMSEAQWKAYVLADNQLAQNATWNEGLLTFELDALAELDFDLDLLGFGDLDALMGDDEPEEGLTDPDEIPDAPEEAITQPGDLWILGEHRLLCGDSTDAESVAYLMDGAKADMVFTDPPYGVKYRSNWKGGRFDELENDDGILNVAAGLTPVLSSDVAIFVCTSHQVYSEWRTQFNDLYKQTVIWHKPGGALGDLEGQYRTDYEMILFCAVGRPLLRNGRGGAVWTVSKDAPSEYAHPTQKPVELITRAVDDFTDKKQTIFDPFLGSGTTLIAAERLGRKCYGIEIDPIYCDVIVARWEAFTGKKAERYGGT